jgi:hypothetical protein
MELADVTMLATRILRWRLVFLGNLYTPVNIIYKKMSKSKEYEENHGDSMRRWGWGGGQAFPNLWRQETKLGNEARNNATILYQASISSTIVQQCTYVQCIASRTQALCCPIKVDMKHAPTTVGTEHMVMPRFEAGVGKPNATRRRCSN